jgi:hypothetical protein
MAEFLVRGPDGRDYPADVLTLKAWAAEGRISGDQYVFVGSNGTWQRAREVSELHDIMLKAPIAPVTPSSSHQTSSSSGAIGYGFITVIVLIVLAIAFGNSGSSSKEDKGTAHAKTGRPSAKAPTGPTMLYAPSLEKIAVARTKEALDRFSRSAARKDRFGFVELALRDEVFLVPSRTRVLVIDHGFITHQVRILEGEHAGETGWVPREWVANP